MAAQDLLGEDDDEGGDSDPEADFLATLSSKDKKKLLKRLQEIEDGSYIEKRSKSE